MAIGKTERAATLKKFCTHETDTGSPQVQVALITQRLNHLNDHFKTHTKDHHSRRGLMKLVGQRKRLLNYLAKQDPGAYKTLITELGLRK